MKGKITYFCTICKAPSPRWQGQCPRCGEWNTLEPGRSRQDRPGQDPSSGAQPVDIKSVDTAFADSISTSMSELDDLLGGGIVPGSVILLGGEPGIGKSTLLLQLCAAMAGKDSPSLYVSGEESLPQIRSRAQRLGLLENKIQAVSTNSLEDVLNTFTSDLNFRLMVIDSVQTLVSPDLDSIPGTPSQIRAVSSMLIQKAKETDTCIILVGHVTKEGQIAGPKMLEHMVDTVLYLEGDKEHLFRILRVVKNRFGPANELVMFEMTGTGLNIVNDPSTFFLQARDPALSGSAVVMAVDGQKPFAVEVQALASSSFLAIPRRTALGFDLNRLHLLLAVMEKKLNLNLAQSDIYGKIGGGLRLGDPGMDLGLVAAVLSSFHNQSLPERSVFWGEIDLNGQVRPVLAQDLRMKQALKLGYKPVFCPKSPNCRTGLATIMELQDLLFN
ncbi:DNA repair protein RadA [Desulfonatronovibrio hydrogenovorans]|uniref:DNA repair protein RadA n=1 Tax=Desulfonatronovibrio hydrogenovorans TaxID=53245 RepID=UPI00048F3060|nr:DNA repair protein RadA [Desulfonatronovibrio hydrogenovorans]